jgi:sensor histidine kinase regulating citrate/malate metabolism
MLKNALEAAKPGENVVLKSQRRGNKVVFEVHNNGCIPEEVQLNIFKRSFSTKGKGRGLGTYSIKLLSENYLKGKVYFESSPDKGTSFFAEYPINPKVDDN